MAMQSHIVANQTPIGKVLVLRLRNLALNFGINNTIISQGGDYLELLLNTPGGGHGTKVKFVRQRGFLHLRFGEEQCRPPMAYIEPFLFELVSGQYEGHGLQAFADRRKKFYEATKMQPYQPPEAPSSTPKPATRVSHPAPPPSAARPAPPPVFQPMTVLRKANGVEREIRRPGEKKRNKSRKLDRHDRIAMALGTDIEQLLAEKLDNMRKAGIEFTLIGKRPASMAIRVPTPLDHSFFLNIAVRFPEGAGPSLEETKTVFIAGFMGKTFVIQWRFIAPLCFEASMGNHKGCRTLHDFYDKVVDYYYDKSRPKPVKVLRSSDLFDRLTTKGPVS